MTMKDHHYNEMFLHSKQWQALL